MPTVVTAYAGQVAAVMGLGRSGMAAARALRDGGATVWVWDDDDDARTQAQRHGFTVRDLRTAAAMRDAAVLVLSPGVPYSHPAPHPAVTAARHAGVSIRGDIALLAQARPAARRLGVTGSNGKSTTTSLLGHILKSAGRTVATGGNLGPPALALAPLDDADFYVLELSSYQLALSPPTRFQRAVLLNISPDHLERHGGLDGYIAAKAQIFAAQQDDDVAIVGVDDEASAGVAADLTRAGRRVLRISGAGPVSRGVGVGSGFLIDASAGPATPVFRLADAPRLHGAHNAQNIAAAWAAARSLGVTVDAVTAALRTWPGLAHRQEAVTTRDGVRFINDSKATNADAAARALACHQRIYWIAGGVEKNGGYDALTPLLPRVRSAFLIGTATPRLAQFLEGRVPTTVCGTLPRAVAQAFTAARADAMNTETMATAPSVDEPVVLLSPACASFDQFRDFEARGDAFRHLALAFGTAVSVATRS